MKKIVLLCVNFHSYNELSSFLTSIDEAASLIAEWKIEVMIADNSDNFQYPIKTSSYLNIDITIFPFYENLGYLNAIAKIVSLQEKLFFTNYQYVVFSNVDIYLSPDFFYKLIHCQVPENVGWIAPSIYSQKEKLDRNPSMLNRPTLKRLKKLIFLYSHPFFFQLYTKIVYPYRRKQRTKKTLSTVMYAGHGSCMIFKGNFIDKISPFQFPSFLFGEEIFLAELLQNVNLCVKYEPAVKVLDIDHINTSKINIRQLCLWHKESLEALMKIFSF